MRHTVYDMDYIQELYSVLNDSNLSLTDKESSILEHYSDEKVYFEKESGTNYTQNKDLKSALHKLIDSGLFFRYIEIILKRDTYSMDNFFNKMDEE